MAIQATKVSNLSFLRSEDVVIARGDLTSKFPVDTANLLIAGVNAGIHYALMYGIPEGKEVDGLYKEYHATDVAMDEEIKLLLKAGGIVKDLLDYEDEVDEE